MRDRDCAAIGWEYAEAVVRGDIPNGQWTIKACQRSLDDRDHQTEFRFDPKKGNRVTSFVERLTHVKGLLGGTLIKLEPWQCWTITQAFGWVHAAGPREGLRRFRTSYLELGRGNGKSCLSSAIGLYMLAADGEWGAEVYSSATTSSQSRIVWGDARAMCSAPASKKLMDALGVSVHAHTITVASRNSRFAPTSSEYSTMDGYNISCSILDELHAMPDRGLWDVIVTGAGKRPQSLIWSITTAGSDRAGICYEQRGYVTKILDKVIVDDSVFGCIWSADESDDWQLEASWRKANPNYGISVEPGYIQSLAVKARAVPAAQSAFKTKHLCQWISADQAWMDMQAWDRCRDESLSIEDFTSDKCFIGLDLASRVDIAAKIKLFVRTINNVPHYFAFGQYYLPESAVADGRNSQYRGWQTAGLTVTMGEVIDFEQIEAELKADAKNYAVQQISYDPWQCESLSQRMIADGAPMLEYRPTVQNFSEPMKELDALVRSGRFHHNDPILTWMASNVVCHRDFKDNIFPRKERIENKIDGIVALISALGCALVHKDDVSIYETRDLLVL